MITYQYLADSTGVNHRTDGIQRMNDPGTTMPTWVPNDPESSDWRGFEAWVAQGNTPLPYVPPTPVVPDAPTLSDWRVGLTLWGRMDDVTNRVATLVASSDPTQAMLGRIAKERLEYANTVLRVQLLALQTVFGFTPADVDESLYRAHQVSIGDLSGKWPLA